jgi:2-polyprenyl-3-methyl-5-hydroxy-6-metoxy-1,4-benzoquinol methylase
MSLTEREAHFEFGENWKSYSKTIDQKRIASAVEGVRKLFPEGLTGKTFLDIGCGSGLHSLAALLLGAAMVTAVDIDENSVSTTQELLTKHAPNSRWTARVASVFDVSCDALGKFDVVYSWGVLHHTGDMWRAIESATDFVRADGQFAIAIYSATACDSMWKAEKKFYSRAPSPIQWSIRQIYMVAFLTHDVHDWLGGYPYETATAPELHDRICKMGFAEERSFTLPVTSGLFGSGCHEFVFRKS